MVFSLVHRVTGDGDIGYVKYKSSETGMTVVMGGVRGPLVHGYLTFATEAHDDDGIPHTLEHLCFLGSEDYPFKGVLDLMANRCLASGSNAWTDTDHTCYTVSTVGSEGFLQILPVYLDHLLYPTLTDDGFVTEVHHINGSGEDAGVVYAEMQARENTGDSRTQRCLLTHMYPGVCGYKSQTGGMMSNLRDSLTNHKIREYHRSFYRPENLCVIITGIVDEDQVLDTLSKFEEKILKKRELESTSEKDFSRPWFTHLVPPLTASVDDAITFPCDEEDSGIVLIGWRGPDCTTDFLATVSLTLLSEYLNDTAVAPLQQAFVETEDPFCSSVSFSLIENSVSCAYFSFDSVDLEKMSEVKDKLFSVLNDMANGVTPVDMERMRAVIHRKKMQLLNDLESSPHFAVASAVIGDFLYGTESSHLDIRVKNLPFYEECAAQGSGFWIDLLKQYFLSRPYVCVDGRPSPDLMKSMAEEEKNRIKAQVQAMGPKGLAAAAEAVDRAKERNERPPPPSMLSDVPIPSVDKIYFHKVKRLTNDPSLKLEEGEELKHVPFRLQVDDLQTNFVTLRVLVNTADLTPDERLFLPLMCELLTESAVFRKGVVVPYEEVVRDLSIDTISASAGIGVGGQFRQLVVLSLRLEESKYEKGIRWLHDLLWETQFQEERIRVVVKRVTSDLQPMKRKGGTVVGDLLRSMTRDSRSNDYACGLFRQYVFLNKVSKRMKDEDATSVLQTLNSIRDKMLMDLSNIRVHVSLNLGHVMGVMEPWVTSFLPSKLRKIYMATDDGPRVGTVNLRPVTPGHELVTPDSDPRAVVAGLGSIESCFLQQVIPSIRSPEDPDLPAVLVLIQYLTQLEGPMWREIRGPGLSYHYSISLSSGEGLLTFLLYKATQLVPAYEAASRIVSSHTNGTSVWDQSLLESARASLIFDLIERENSIPRVSAESLLNYLKGLPMTYMRDLVAKVAAVTVQDLARVAPKRLAPLFSNDSSHVVVRRSVVCKPASVDQVTCDFKKLGVDLVAVSLEDEENLVSKL